MPSKGGETFERPGRAFVQVVSGLDRMIPSPSGKPIPGAIQTDAAINSGEMRTAVKRPRLSRSLLRLACGSTALNQAVPSKSLFRQKLSFSGQF